MVTPGSVWTGDATRSRYGGCAGRIFKAVQAGDLAAARNLQKLMLRSWSNTLVSVRQVTQRNTGRRTAGIDGQVALTSQARAEMAVQVHASIELAPAVPGPAGVCTESQ